MGTEDVTAEKTTDVLGKSHLAGFCSKNFRDFCMAENVKERIYFLGIGGVAMGNAAILSQRSGHVVGGSDRAIYSPMRELLARERIVPFAGFSPQNMTEFRPDVIVVGNGVGRGNAEVEWLLNERPCPFLSLPEFLAARFLSNRHRIVVAGTHGKTTTTALTAFYLRQLGSQAGYFIGGAPVDFPSGADLGEKYAPFVIEGDEYDSAFFDKRSKFIHYAPNTLVINAIDFDHADIFRDIEDVCRTFNHLLRTVPGNGHVFLNGDDRNCLDLVTCQWTQFFRVGLGDSNDFQIKNFITDDGGSHWQVLHAGKVTHMRTQLLGEFNARNATMAILAAHCALSLPLSNSIDLRNFRGVRRRQEILHRDGQCVVYEDFAHHPRATWSMLQSLRQRYPNCELICCFEPASNTSARRVLFEEFVQSFCLCDRCYLAPVRNGEAIPENERCSMQEMAGRLRSLGKDAIAFADNDQMREHLLQILASAANQFRVVALFSNAAFDGVLSHWR
ncbi:MAG: Mur ligase domain-containing protein, partial [Puniceicoccales bacterium]|nr:Mur ligase domain-containing protein [Puniceicoccales bacterium]